MIIVQCARLSQPDSGEFVGCAEKVPLGRVCGVCSRGPPIVCQMARELPNHRSQYTSRVKRLDLTLAPVPALFGKTRKTEFVVGTTGPAAEMGGKSGQTDE